MRSLSRFAVVAGVCSWLCCAPMLWAQGTTSRIAGIVEDKSGAMISGAKVTVTNEGTNTSYSWVYELPFGRNKRWGGGLERSGE